ncbi:MAG: HyaD/HybD family hydrogenase maturation endopeptidase [Gammaproteobacteria bacterium]
MSVLILAVGNLLLTDEGTGIHVLRHLIKHHPDLPGVEFLDGGTLSFTLAGPIEEADALIVIDAAELLASPGTVRVFEDEDMDKQLGLAKLSVHEVGLIDLMDMVRLSGHLPERRALVGIQPLTIAEWGELPSPPVAAAIPQAAEAVLNILDRWNDQNPG